MGVNSESRQTDGGSLSRTKEPDGSIGTEKRLVEIATHLFCTRGFDGTSIAEIAQALNVRNAAIYYYVSSKQDLLLKVLEEGMMGFLERLEEVVELPVDDREKLRLALDNHIDFIFDNPHAVGAFLRERRFLDHPRAEEYFRKVDRYDARFTEVIACGVQAGEFPKVDPGLTSLAILGMINSIIEWYEPEGRLSSQEIKQQMMSMILDRLLLADS